MVVRLDNAVRRAQRSSRTDRRVLVGAVVLFVVATGIAIRRLPPLVDVRPSLLVVAGFVGLVTLAINAWEFSATSRSLGLHVPAWTAVRTTVMASAANMLPVPGAVAVKTRGVVVAGGRGGAGLSTVSAAGLLWLCFGLLAAGVALSSRTLLASLSYTFAAACLVLAWLLLGTTPEVDRPRTIARLAVISALSVVNSTLRLWLILMAFGAGTALGALALTAAAVVSSAVGLLPGGLGLREALSAGAGALVDADPSLTLVVAAVDRLVMLVVTAITSVVTLRAPNPLRPADHD